MEYGILIVEDGNELFQILGSVWSLAEARELAQLYERAAAPENPDASVPPTEFVIHRRGPGGYYTRREPLELRPWLISARPLIADQLTAAAAL